MDNLTVHTPFLSTLPFGVVKISGNISPERLERFRKDWQRVMAEGNPPMLYVRDNNEATIKVIGTNKIKNYPRATFVGMMGDRLKRVFIGISVCSSEDQFNRKKGRKMAMDRVNACKGIWHDLSEFVTKEDRRVAALHFMYKLSNAFVLNPDAVTDMIHRQSFYNSSEVELAD